MHVSPTNLTLTLTRYSVSEHLSMEEIFIYLDNLPTVLATGGTQKVSQLINGIEVKLTGLLGNLNTSLNQSVCQTGKVQRIQYMITQATQFKQW